MYLYEFQLFNIINFLFLITQGLHSDQVQYYAYTLKIHYFAYKLALLNIFVFNL